MNFFRILLLLAFAINAQAQRYLIFGRLQDEKGLPIKNAEISITGIGNMKAISHEGNFSLFVIRNTIYELVITSPGKEIYYDSIKITDTFTNLGPIQLIPEVHMLNEVKIVEKILVMAQKDDTLEFNSGAYKMNPDADADELVKKMPSIEITGKQITSQGENVLKVLIDGKPFFGNDPYSSLKNIPADVIAKVQIYNEKTDQEQFTGFSEGPTIKTINIVTKNDKKKGLFGKAYSGAGDNIPARNVHSDDEKKYGIGGIINSFSGERRLTATLQSNNINEQNFTEQNINSINGGGMVQTKATGINLSDKWGKNVDATINYTFHVTESNTTRQLQKTYIAAADSGQVYNESEPSHIQTVVHNVNLRFNYTIDSMNSVLIQSQGANNKNISDRFRKGSTNSGNEPVNNTVANNRSNTNGYSFSGNILYRHKFNRKGRTFSLGINTNRNTSFGVAINDLENIYYLSPQLSDTLQQRSTELQNMQTLTGNVVYTESLNEDNILKVEYNVSYRPSISERLTSNYSPLIQSYSLPDNLYSNSFNTVNTSHKAGISYMYQKGDYELSAGGNFQYTLLENEQTLPVTSNQLHAFQNLLPVASFRYKLSKTKNIQFNYSTATQSPLIIQLQNVVNNSDPLHLYVGNPSLKQPFLHSGILRYNTSSAKARSNFSVSVSGRYSQHSIVSNTLIASSDTIVTAQHLLLPKWSRLTMPENIDGATNVSSSMNYGIFVSSIKCYVNIGMNVGIATTPAIINKNANYQENKTGSLDLSLNSNLSEKIDFSLSTTARVISTANSINNGVRSNYFSENSSTTLNLILWKGVVFYTGLNYSVNSGLPEGYNKNYLLWNMSIGKKIFKKHQGDIRITMFDLLNDNNNIQHSITDTYIQDVQSNIIQRYYMLIFTYKIREFRK